MNDKNKAFCYEYIKGFHAARAYKAIYPSAAHSTCKVNSTRLLLLPEIRAYLKELKTELAEDCKIEALDLINELKKIAFADITDFHNKEITEMSDTEAIAEIEETEFSSGGELTRKTRKIKLHDKLKAIDMLAKHLGFYEKDNQQKTSITIEFGEE